MSELTKKFEKMGARVKLTENSPSPRRFFNSVPQPDGCVLDIRRDKEGEYFDILKRGKATLQVVDCRPEDRHLLLSVNAAGNKSKFLCGHDERHWFVAAIPEKAGNVSSVKTAMEALKPEEVKKAVSKAGVKEKKKNRRKNKGFIRQGEWFFLPDEKLKVNSKLILKNEPIRRGRGKPHTCEELYRVGGVTVWVSSQYPNGVTESEFKRITSTSGYNAKAYRWTVMKRDAEVYVRGKISHSDHATITLPCWHKVVMNTETQARAMRQLAFLD